MIRIIVVLLLFPAVVFCQDIQFKTGLDSTKYLVGDEIKINIKAEYPESYRLQLPQKTDTLKPLEFLYLDTLSLEKGNGTVSAQFRYVVMGFDSGLFKIPQLDFSFVSTNDAKIVKSDSFYVLVSTVAVDTSQAIKDIKALEKIPFDYSFLYWLIPALLILGYAVYRFIRYLKMRKKEPEEVKAAPLLPAYEEALQALKHLEEQQLWQKGLVKEFHSEITGIIRNFFEREYELPALESTSYETVNALREMGLPPEMVSKTEEFLSNADMVKFARFVPMSEVNQKMISSSYEIISFSKNISHEQK